ncbi:hypothetical protein L0B52_08660 [Suttonella sp. R2A3]|uniref:hypothetical protein n=1 Tax=Suttonella sp. R2A3 TaxID=2908648 RepID=UPI001F3BD677|nr:hypothetical protein [Suttonella sp. R2A3]UJF24391.1 hypothetical protein L0B52_08660 [Suttonella sp. R2A3]
MKVLLVSVDLVPRYFGVFLASFRSLVGTCDHIELNSDAVKDEQRRIRILRREPTYDHVIFFSSSHEQAHIWLEQFSDIEHFVLLSMQYEPEVVLEETQRFFQQYPWARWIGCDKDSFRYYTSLGIDAYRVRPVVFQERQPIKTNTQGAVCHALGRMPGKHKARLFAQSNHFVYQSCHEEAQLRRYIRNEVNYGDILLIYAEAMLREHLLIEALVKGSVVVVPKSFIHTSNERWIFRSGCLVADNLEEVQTLMREGSDPDVMALLVEKSMRYVEKNYAPNVLAEELARLLHFKGRVKDDFMVRRK